MNLSVTDLYLLLTYVTCRVSLPLLVINLYKIFSTTLSGTSLVLMDPISRFRKFPSLLFLPLKVPVILSYLWWWRCSSLLPWCSLYYLTIFISVIDFLRNWVSMQVCVWQEGLICTVYSLIEVALFAKEEKCEKSKLHDCSHAMQVGKVFSIKY